jgi:hypothetical protein
MGLGGAVSTLRGGKLRLWTETFRLEGEKFRL